MVKLKSLCNKYNCKCLGLIWILQPDSWILVYFHIGINFTHKQIRAHVADGAADDAQCTAEQCHVAKVEGRLEQTKHSAKKRTKLFNRISD